MSLRQAGRLLTEPRPGQHLVERGVKDDSALQQANRTSERAALGLEQTPSLKKCSIIAVRYDASGKALTRVILQANLAQQERSAQKGLGRPASINGKLIALDRIGVVPTKCRLMGKSGK